MQYFLGIDEAGYGPNLGPLVISATVWQLPDGVQKENLYERLGDVVVSTRREASGKSPACVAIADSKALYQPGAGLRHLERGLWAAWALLGCRPTSWSGIRCLLAPDAGDAMESIPWYNGCDRTVPVDADPDELDSLAGAVREAFDAAGVGLLTMQTRAVFPNRFNELLEEHGSKGAALSHLTLDLVAELMQPIGDGSITVVCDKHGGRNRYAGLLAEHFPDALMEIYDEGARRSVYRFGPARRRVEIRFERKAETHLPVALASMASKYFRELAMKSLNRFWCERVPGLKPTAGYPQDAKRFKEDIAAVQDELEIKDRILWRNK